MSSVQTLTPLRPVALDGKHLDLIRRTVAADTNAEEFDLFIEAAKRVGLDPFRKQIYAVVYNKDSKKKRKMAIITGIDGFRAVADRSGNYRPDENEPEIVYRDDLKDPDSNPLGIEKATVTVHKRDVNGEWFPVKGWAYWDEYAPLKQEWDKKENCYSGPAQLSKTSNWYKMPRVMLPKCAEGQALRKGWPEDLSGVYAPEEMAQAEILDVTATEAAEKYQEDRRLIATNTGDSITFLWNAGDELEPVPLGQIADRIMAFLKSADYSTQVTVWMDHNRRSLQEYWARCKSEALEVRKELDACVATLEAEEAKAKAEDDQLPPPQ